MNKSYLVSLSKGASIHYLTMSNQRGQSRIMCFENKKDAQRCKEYVIAYKTAYGHWPSLDMSNNEQKIEYAQENISSYDAIYSQVYVNEIDENTFDYFCEHKKMNFLLCNSFNTFIEGNKHNLDFSGREYVCQSDDLFTNIRNLDTIYEKS